MANTTKGETVDTEKEKKKKKYTKTFTRENTFKFRIAKDVWKESWPHIALQISLHKRLGNTVEKKTPEESHENVWLILPTNKVKG